MIVWCLLIASLFEFQKIDITNELVEDVMVKTREYLQPNPGSFIVDIYMRTVRPESLKFS